MPIIKFLEDLNTHKNNGGNVPKQITFTNCDSFSNLNQKDINTLKSLSKSLGLSIVGSTSKTASAYLDGEVDHAGHYIKFSSDGSIMIDERCDTTMSLDDEELRGIAATLDGISVNGNKISLVVEDNALLGNLPLSCSPTKEPEDRSLFREQHSL